MTDDIGIELLVMELAEAISPGHGGELLEELGEETLIAATQQILDFRQALNWMIELQSESLKRISELESELKLLESEEREIFTAMIEEGELEPTTDPYPATAEADSDSEKDPREDNGASLPS